MDSGAFHAALAMLSRSFLLAGVLSAPFAAVACGVSLADGDGAMSAGDPPFATSAGMDASAGFGSEASPALLRRGSRLCNLSERSCVPDQGEAACGSGPDAGATGDAATWTDAAADGSPGVEAGTRAEVLGCRVSRSGSSVSTKCGGAGTGIDGAVCAQSTDCAPGFECSQSGVCRRYCCMGTCPEANKGSAPLFCDVQSTRGTNLIVPLCMPVQPARGCVPLGTECGPKRTCAVVGDNGQTSCVDIGPAEEGEDCEAMHCAAGLVCIGPFDGRRCARLCKYMDGGTYEGCGNQRCVPSAQFPSGFGICQ